MPIHPDNKKRYPKDWPVISRRIRFVRAAGRCECVGECGIEHPERRCDERHDTPARRFEGRVILTVAHLDHVPENCDPMNLRAMCQRCHLRYDSTHHARSRAARRAQAG